MGGLYMRNYAHGDCNMERDADYVEKYVVVDYSSVTGKYSM